MMFFFFFSSRRRHTRCSRDWSSDVCSSDLSPLQGPGTNVAQAYAHFARDYREGTHLCPTFDDAVTRHRMLDAIERAAATGQRQTITPGRDIARFQQHIVLNESTESWRDIPGNSPDHL